MKQCSFALALFLGLTACKQGVVEKKDNGTTVGYAKLIYATIGKAFFANKAVYFVIINLAALLIIRLVLKLLFR